MVDSTIRMLCEWKNSEVVELNVQVDYIDFVFSEPNVSTSSLMRVLKGKTAIKQFLSYPDFKKELYCGNHFFGRGYFVNIVGLDEEMI